MQSNLRNKAACHLKLASARFDAKDLVAEEEHLSLALTDALATMVQRPQWYKGAVRAAEIFEAASPATLPVALFYYQVAVELNGDDVVKKLTAKIESYTHLARTTPQPTDTSGIARALRWLDRIPAHVESRSDTHIVFLRHVASVYRQQQRPLEAVQHLSKAVSLIQQQMSFPRLAELVTVIAETYMEYASCLHDVGDADTAVCSVTGFVCGVFLRVVCALVCVN